MLLTKNTMLTHLQSHDIVHDTLDKLGFCDAACPIKYSNKMTRAMGYAWYKGSLSNIWDYGIKLSKVLMPYIPGEEQIETVVHEACHIATYLVGEKGHGRLWKQYMRQCGYTPRRCHSYSYGHIAKCKCATHAVSPKRYNKAKYRICKSCRQKLNYTGEFGVISYE